MNVSELMSRPAVTCWEEDTLQTVVSLMVKRGCGAIPVVDQVARITGIITCGDICLSAHEQRKSLDEIRVAEVPLGSVVSVVSDDTIEHAEQLMRERRVRRLAVLDQRDRVAGMLSLSDILSARQQMSEMSSHSGRAGEDHRRVSPAEESQAQLSGQRAIR